MPSNIVWFASAEQNTPCLRFAYRHRHSSDRVRPDARSSRAFLEREAQTVLTIDNQFTE